jgi:hypothetical protein
VLSVLAFLTKPSARLSPIVGAPATSRS